MVSKKERESLNRLKKNGKKKKIGMNADPFEHKPGLDALIDKKRKEKLSQR